MVPPGGHQGHGQFPIDVDIYYEDINVTHVSDPGPLGSLVVNSFLTVLFTPKAPPIICSRRQFQILPLFQK